MRRGRRVCAQLRCAGPPYNPPDFLLRHGSDMFLRLLCCALALVMAVPAVHAAEPPANKPVASVRVAFDREGIVAIDVLGLADVASGRKVSAGDPVRIASISKLVTAIGVMRLVEDGRLDLDADVSELLGWPLRHPGFPDQPITLRLLL